ncbi:MAG: NCS2 family permease, partial [Actinobacteria bacterium]|nr:NCS2 family permease [Actinomycetota bacterium]
MTKHETSTRAQPRNGLDRYFKISERGSSIRTEVRGGLTTFFTMAYIVVLNPLIIGTVPDADGRTLGIPQVAAVTALVAAVMTIAMGLIGRYPFAVATGLGLNAFVTFSVASQMSWADAMGLVVLEGLVIAVLVLVGLRQAVFNAIPTELKTAISVGIGLFIALIGFVDAGFVRRTGTGPVPVELGTGGELGGWPTVVFVIGLLLTAVLVARRTTAAILIGIVVTTVLAIVAEAVFDIGPSFISPEEINERGWQLNVPALPESIVELPDLSLLGDFSLFGGFARAGVIAALLLVFTLMLADFFDTMGTIVGVGKEADLLDEQGRLPGADKVLLVDSLSAVAGGAASASSNTTYIESAAGVGDGARTGLASVVTGLLFLVALLFTPLVTVVPFEAAAPALVIVGFLLLTQIRNISFDDYAIAIPAF